MLGRTIVATAFIYRNDINILFRQVLTGVDKRKKNKNKKKKSSVGTIDASRENSKAREEKES
jgi:hypothetical protein